MKIQILLLLAIYSTSALAQTEITREVSDQEVKEKLKELLKNDPQILNTIAEYEKEKEVKCELRLVDGGRWFVGGIALASAYYACLSKGENFSKLEVLVNVPNSMKSVASIHFIDAYEENKMTFDVTKVRLYPPTAQPTSAAAGTAPENMFIEAQKKSAEIHRKAITSGNLIGPAQLGAGAN